MTTSGAPTATAPCGTATTMGRGAPRGRTTEAAADYGPLVPLVPDDGNRVTLPSAPNDGARRPHRTGTTPSGQDARRRR